MMINTHDKITTDQSDIDVSKKLWSSKLSSPLGWIEYKRGRWEVHRAFVSTCKWK